MALAIDKPSAFGVAASYHRIFAVQFYYAERCIDVTVAGYATREARDAGAAPLLVPPAVRLSFGDDGEPTREAIYAAIKAMPEWADSVDC